jgi:hypothetical protein
MRLVRLKLRGSSPFWMLYPIRLHANQETSPLINIDLLTEIEMNIINESVKSQDIWLLDSEGIRINGNLNDVGVTINYEVSTEDLPSEEDIPEMISVTVGGPEEEDDDDDDWIIDPKFFEEASRLLGKHPSTAKKFIKALEETKENLMLLQALHSKELEGKKRKGMVELIEAKIKEY